MVQSRATSFLQDAVGAFPTVHRPLAEEAARILAPFVDTSYQTACEHAIVLGGNVQIPRRIHFLELGEEASPTEDALRPAVQCLCTRSTDGYIRQASLRRIIGLNEPWVIPFVVLLAGEYVIEIIEDMQASLPLIDRAMYIDFVRQNRPFMRVLRARATSYWNQYYRRNHPDRRSYPGLSFLHQLELWAD